MNNRLIEILLIVQLILMTMIGILGIVRIVLM